MYGIAYTDRFRYFPPLGLLVHKWLGGEAEKGEDWKKKRKWGENKTRQKVKQPLFVRPFLSPCLTLQRDGDSIIPLSSSPPSSCSSLSDEERRSAAQPLSQEIKQLLLAHNLYLEPSKKN